MSAPKCRACGKALRRWKARNWDHNAGKLGADGKPAEWGDYGDNAFCGRTCGHAYAIAIVTHVSKKERA